jgi:glycosyltransferase involved in cell wall biosynthesis
MVTLGEVRDLLRRGLDDEARRALDEIADATRRVGIEGEAFEAERLALSGVLALRSGGIAEAARLFECSLAVSPTLDASLNLAAIGLGTGDSEGAARALAAGLRVAPEHPQALILQREVAARSRSRSAAPDAGRPLAIWFCQPRSLPCDARTPLVSPLGGTESALVYLAAALARRGHRVRVYNNCPSPGQFDEVAYRRWEDARADAVLDPPDVLVGIRDWTLVGANRYAPLQLFWTGDAADQPSSHGLGEADSRAAIDLFVFQSGWQERGYRDAFGVPPWRCVRTRLGYAPFILEGASTRPPRMVYTSTPFRGLDLLLEWIPLIRARCPDAELRVCSSMRVYGMDAAEDWARHGALYERARQPGVTLLGSLAQTALAEELAEARVLAYPNRWAETFCIAAIEAEAAGCPVLTSSLGALPETVGDGGICLPGDPRGDAFRDRFVEEAVSLLTDDERWARISGYALRRARRDYAWDGIAAGWERMCRSGLSGEGPLMERVATHAAAGRFELIDRMLAREEPPAAVSGEAWLAVRQLARWMSTPGGAAAPDSRILATIGPLRRLRAFDQWAARAQGQP